MKLRIFWNLQGLMMEAACTSETSVDIQLRTRQYIPEDSELHTRRRENLKSQTPTVDAIISAKVNVGGAMWKSIRPRC
jgi:hypothetical protein